jgi:crotonobetainyl-CoA:carnitine CoA-transferase CaiB-like acyl-CoA transferase
MVRNSLSDIRIIELGQIIAGTYGGQILSDMGAQVIKVESPKGDLGRNPSVAPYKGESGLFLTFNRNKKSMVIDLKNPQGRQLFLDLVKESDVVVDNFRSGVMKRLGIDYPELQKVNPRIIHCSITGFGSEGEYKDYPALDIIIQAISGHMAITGEKGRPPARLGIPLADLSGGLFSSQGILAALYEREKTGKGQHIELAMFDAMLSLLTYLGTMWLNNEELPSPPGSSHEYTVPWQAFQTKDSYVVVAAREEVHWKSFCRALGLEEISTDPRFANNFLRVENRQILVPILEEKMLEEETHHWMEIFRREDVPASPVNHFDTAFAEPPVLQNQAVVEYDHPKVGKVRFPAYPVKMGNGAEMISTPAPDLGEHTQEVLKDILLCSAERIDHLVQSGVVVCK